MIRDARRGALRLPGTCPDARFVRGDGLAPPFEDVSFDLVVTSHFFGHLTLADRKRFLREARRLVPTLVVVDAALRESVEPEEIQERVLNDGSRFNVYKRYFTADRLAAELRGGETLMDGTWFVAVRA